MPFQTKVLIVDDSEMSLDMLELILSHADCTCVRAADGQEALKQLELHPDVDVITLDLLMPVMDGYQLLEQLTKDVRLSNIPVIVISSDCKNVVRVLAMGASDFMAKPYDPEEVTLRIQNLARMKCDAESVHRANGEFVAAASHELRTPLNGITGLTDILLDEVENGPVHEHLSELKDSIEGLTTIVGNLLDYFSLDALSRLAPVVSFCLTDIVEQSVGSVEERARAKSVALNLDVPPDLSVHLLGFPDRIRKIFFNLIDSSIKFAPAGGTVQIKVRPVPASEGRCSYLCTVSDNGIGVDVQEFQEIFELTNQGTGFGSNSLCQRIGGTGIGLVVALRMARSIGGSITLESEPGSGSTFYISFDAAVDPEAQHHQTSKSVLVASDAVSLKILLVEDNQVNQKVASWQLLKLGHRVELAGNGQEAVTRWQQEEFDLIFMDLQMPGMDGFEATRIIRAAEKGTGRRIPIVAQTAYGSENSEAHCSQVGMDSFITKPIRPADLACVIRQIFVHGGGHE
jgi:two-component system, sensor histidine kinase